MTVNPNHLRDLRVSVEEPEAKSTERSGHESSDRPRRIRDAVEAALSDILLLGTEEQVRLAGQAAADMAAGRPIHTAELVVSLRNYIRMALDLEPYFQFREYSPPRPCETSGSGARSGKSEAGRERSGDRGGGAGGAGGMGMWYGEWARWG